MLNCTIKAELYEFTLYAIALNSISPAKISLADQLI